MTKSIINTDQFVEGFGGFECLQRSKAVNYTTGNRIVAGSVFIYLKQMKTWTSAFGFHYWNEDREGNVWDSVSMWENYITPRLNQLTIVK